jgi:hypothetical protein
MDRWIKIMDSLIACELRNYKSQLGLMACELSNCKSYTSFMPNYEFFPTDYEIYFQL